MTIAALAHGLDCSPLEAFEAAGIWPDGVTLESVEMAQRIEALGEHDRRLLTVLLEAMEGD